MRIPEKPFIRPFEPEFIDYLYHIYQGKIRFIMEAINTLVPFLSSEAPSTLSTEEARRKLKEILKEEIFEKVTPQEWEILKVVVQRESFTNKEISKILDIAPSNVSRLLKSLSELQLILPLFKKGNRLFYRVHEDTKALLDEVYQPVYRRRSSLKTVRLTNRLKRVEKARKHFRNQSLFNTSEYATLCEVSLGTARNDLKSLEKEGKLIRRGKTKNTLYGFSEGEL